VKRILDPQFRYVPSFGTDVRRTFERVRREQRAALERRVADLRLVSPAPQKRSGQSN